MAAEVSSVGAAGGTSERCQEQDQLTRLLPTWQSTVLASNLRSIVRDDSLEGRCDLSLKRISSDSDLIESWLEASRKLEV